MRTDVARILLVEDEPEILALVRRYLEQEGHRVVAAMDGESALRLQDGADLVILDLMLPVLGGLDVIRGLRSQGHDVPILILSAREDEEDRVTGLDLGADDYLTKPFRPKELLARVRALLRRARSTAPVRDVTPAVSIDPDLRRAVLSGKPLDLTPLEFDLLRHLVARPGKNCSREELLERVWGAEYMGETRRVDLLVSKLRAKLAPRDELIRSVWGVGYRYEA